MCGIFGYVGKKDPLKVCLDGLLHLEYRGYDSTGVGGIHKGQIVLCKRAGKLSFLKERLDLPRMDLAIAHTRWATHGKVNDENAHPHLDADGSIALIHNGVIENYAELKADLLKEGVKFSSETDSEVVVNLISKYYEGDLVKALHKAISFLKGIFAFLVIHKNHPDEIIAAARECPLSIGLNEDGTESIISSDPNTFLGRFDILFLKGGEIARVQKNKVEIFNNDLNPVEKKSERLEIDSKPPSKEGFDHFMIKEIFEQPSTLKKAMFGRFDGEIFFEELKLTKEFLKSIRQIWILGCGTSAHAGMIGAILFEDLARFPASVEIASEARYRNPLLSSETLVIAISQSGETADTLAAIREAKKYGCKVLALCNVQNSTLVREADGVLYLKAGPEMSVCSTKAFTSQLATFALFVLYFAHLHHRLSKEQVNGYLSELQKLPSQIEEILNRTDEIKKLAEKYTQYEDFFFMGRRYMYPTCMEAALKLKEISYVNANGYPAGELKHGPIALLSPKFPVIAFCANHKTREKIGSNLTEVKARNAPLLAIAPKSYTELKPIADDIFFIPDAIDEFAPFLSTVAGQLFAYYFAKKGGFDIDQPRNLAKSVTVE